MMNGNQKAQTVEEAQRDLLSATLDTTKPPYPDDLMPWGMVVAFAKVACYNSTATVQEQAIAWAADKIIELEKRVAALTAYIDAMRDLRSKKDAEQEHQYELEKMRRMFEDQSYRVKYAPWVRYDEPLTQPTTTEEITSPASSESRQVSFGQIADYINRQKGGW